MPKILCNIPGAPTEIGGASGPIKFEPTDGGLVAAVGDAVAKRLLSIPGYSLVPDARTGQTDEQKAAEAAEREALLARAAAVNLAVTATWKLPRLKNEVEHAEKLAAEKKAAAGTPTDGGDGK